MIDNSLQQCIRIPADTRCAYNQSPDHIFSGFQNTSRHIGMLTNYHGSVGTGIHRQIATIQHETINNSKQNASKQAIRNEFTACLGVWMHDWHTVRGTLPLHLIALIQVSGEHTDKPNKTSSSPSKQRRRTINTTHYVATDRFHVLSRVRNRRHSRFQLAKRGLWACPSGQVVCNFTTQNSNEHAKHDYKPKCN